MTTDLSHVKAYVRAGILIFPSLVCLEFSRIFLMPKLREIWEMSGITHPNVLGIMKLTNGIHSYGTFIFPAVVVLIIVLEFLVKPWRKLRGPVLNAIVLMAHLYVLVGIIAMSTSAMILVPYVLARQTKNQDHSEISPTAK